MTLTITSNLSSLLIRHSLKKSTDALNQSIERMTTGFRINTASDDAAGFSVARGMDIKLSSYNVAKDNTAIGMSYLNTATSNLDLVTTHLQRIRDLAEEAANGTYSSDARAAIQTEINQRTNEINRIMDSTQYNGKKVFSSPGFIDTVTPLTESQAVAQGYTVIKTADQLQAMNNNKSGKYILMNDIDLSGYNWTPVGDSTNRFTGTFNGNGYAIKNLTINNSASDYQGLFGFSDFGSVIKNVGLTNVNIKGKNYVGGLVGGAFDSIENCYVTGCVTGQNAVGGLAGMTNNYVVSSYSISNISGNSFVGGLIGHSDNSVEDSFSSGSVISKNDAGGLIGWQENSSQSSSISVYNCYSNSSVTGGSGLIGVSDSFVELCYARGSVSGGGGLIGDLFGSVINCYYDMQATGQSEGVENGIDDSIGVTSSELDNIINSGSLPKFKLKDKSNNVNLNVGIDSSAYSSISVDSGISISLAISVSSAESAKNSLYQIDELLSKVTKKQTELGAAYNRLDSVSDSIDVSIANLTSSLSTVKNADVAKESAHYIKSQILQQACASLLITANQTPSIALSLI